MGWVGGGDAFDISLTIVPSSCFSLACTIKLDDRVIVTGGDSFPGDPSSIPYHYQPTSVVQYKDEINWRVWEPLNTGRLSHGCGHFINSDGQMVNCFGGNKLYLYLFTCSGVACNRGMG